MELYYNWRINDCGMMEMEIKKNGKRSWVPLKTIDRNDIKKVIYNDPATIIIWGDDSKTIAKCNDKDSYSPEAGFAICVAKHYRENYYHDLNKSIKVTQEQWDEYRKAYKAELNYWGGGNSEAPAKTISLSRVNHLDIEDKLAIVNGERVKSIKSLIKNKEKKEAKKA